MQTPTVCERMHVHCRASLRIPWPDRPGYSSYSTCNLDARCNCDAGLSAVNTVKSLMARGIPAANIGMSVSIGSKVGRGTFGPKDVATLASFVVRNGVGAATYDAVNIDCDSTGDTQSGCSGLGLGLPPFYFANAFDAALRAGTFNPCAAGNGGCSPDASCTYNASTASMACTSWKAFAGDGSDCTTSVFKAAAAPGAARAAAVASGPAPGPRAAGPTNEMPPPRRRHRSERFPAGHAQPPAGQAGQAP